MRSRSALFACVAGALCALLSAPRAGAETSGGSTGAAFLQLGIGAEAGAMGDANAAWADNVYGAYYNPAGLAGIDRQVIGFTHNTLVLDLDYNYIGYALPLRNNATFGASLMYVDLGTVDRRTVNTLTGDPSASLGTASGNDLAVSLTYARTLTDFLDLGATLKIVNETLADKSSTAFAMDFGGKWRPPIEGLTVGLSLSHLGTSLRFVREDDELPITLRFGAGYRAPSRRWGLTADLVWTRDEDLDAKFGGEYWIMKDRFALRAGANSANDPGRGFTVGAAFAWQDLKVDYAYIPYGDLGDQNMLSLAYEFGPERMKRGEGPRIEASKRAEPESSRKRETAKERREREAREKAAREDLIGSDRRGGPVAMRNGAFAEAFQYQSGPAEHSWIGGSVDDVLNAKWRREGFAASIYGAARFTIQGDYWVVGDRLILSARVYRDGAESGEANASGFVAEPFGAWSELQRGIDNILVSEGAPVLPLREPSRAPRPAPQMPSAPIAPAPYVAPSAPSSPSPDPVWPVHAPAAPAAPVAAPVVAPASAAPVAPAATVAPAAPVSFTRWVAIASVVEYPAMRSTDRARRFESELARELAALKCGVSPDAAHRFTATLSYLEGGEIIVYGKLTDLGTGIPLGSVEAQSENSDEAAAARSAAARILSLLR